MISTTTVGSEDKSSPVISKGSLVVKRPTTIATDVVIVRFFSSGKSNSARDQFIPQPEKVQNAKRQDTGNLQAQSLIQLIEMIGV